MVGFVGVFTQRSPVLFRRKRRILRIRGLLSAVATGNCWSQTAHTASTGPVWGFAGVVSLPRPLTGHKSPYRAEFGFGLLAGDSEKDHPPFQQSRVSNRAEEKKSLPCFSKIEPVKFVIPCKRFSKPPGENPFSLFMQRRFCAATGGPQDVCSTVFSYTNSGPGLSMAGS